MLGTRRTAWLWLVWGVALGVAAFLAYATGDVVRSDTTRIDGQTTTTLTSEFRTHTDAAWVLGTLGVVSLLTSALVRWRGQTTGSSSPVSTS